jgi:hypothetical protein
VTADYWGNWHLVPFLLKDGEYPQFLFCIGVESVNWLEEEAKICEYCGAQHTGPICSSCGNTAPGQTVHNLGKAVATLYGPMPEANSIFYLPTGVAIDIVNRPCGPRDVYAERDVVLRLAGCKVVGRKMPDLVCAMAEPQEMVILYVSIECEVELYPNGLEEND